MGRHGLRFDEWPESDRSAWELAIADGDVFDGRGPAARWRAATRKTNINHYGAWLGFLRDAGQLKLGQKPEERVTAEAVRAYIEYLRLMVAPCTVVTMLVGLKVTIMAMAPRENWRWLADICNALNRQAEPVRDKESRILPAEEIYATAVAELARQRDSHPQGRNTLCAWRNTLMIALLSARPLRLKNFAALELREHLRRVGSNWLITVPADEVKNGMPLEFDLIPSLIT